MHQSYHRVSRTLSAPLFRGFVLLSFAASVLCPTDSARASSPGGCVIVSQAEVLQSHSVQVDGELYFRHPNGARARFLTSVHDREIANAGDGQFHPVSVSEVERAIQELPSELLEDLNCTIFILPYPRSGLLSSSADGGSIYLSPGVREYSAAQTHFLVAHELGHVFQRQNFPESDVSRWSQYREIRGIEDSSVYADSSPHANQPREIFAEDFRVFFGGELARGSGAVENRDFQSPQDVAELPQFLRDIAGIPSDLPNVGSFASTEQNWMLSPNPSGVGSQITLAARSSSSRSVVGLAVIDVTGREVSKPQFRVSGTHSWTLDIDEDQIRRGAYYLRIRTKDGKASTIPLRRLS